MWPAALYTPMVVWQGWCATGLGGWSTRGIELFVLVPLWGLLLAIGGGLMAFSRGLRSLPAGGARAGMVTGCALVLAFVPCAIVGQRLRMRGFLRAGERAAPLVAAIDSYIADQGRPPESLEELVPRWLRALPERLPPLQLVTDTDRNGNRWLLVASVPSGILNFDEFVYLPNQDYSRGWGGSFQRLGRWGYLHE